MVVRKKGRSQPRQKPPGSRETTLPTFPRRANSNTIRAPIELPTTSMPMRSFATRYRSTMPISPSNVPLSCSAGVAPVMDVGTGVEPFLFCRMPL